MPKKRSKSKFPLASLISPDAPSSRYMTEEAGPTASQSRVLDYVFDHTIGSATDSTVLQCVVDFDEEIGGGVIVARGSVWLEATTDAAAGTTTASVSANNVDFVTLAGNEANSGTAQPVVYQFGLVGQLGPSGIGGSGFIARNNAAGAFAAQGTASVTQAIAKNFTVTNPVILEFRLDTTDAGTSMASMFGYMEVVIGSDVTSVITP